MNNKIFAEKMIEFVNKEIEPINEILTTEIVNVFSENEEREALIKEINEIKINILQGHIFIIRNAYNLSKARKVEMERMKLMENIKLIQEKIDELNNL